MTAKTLKEALAKTYVVSKHRVIHVPTILIGKKIKISLTGGKK